VTAAAELFWRQGYAQTGVNEIIAAAETTSGSFYHFFPAKDDLLLAVVDHASELLDHQVFAVAEQIEDPVEQVFSVLDASRRHLQVHDLALGSPIGGLVSEVSASHPRVREHLENVFEHWTGRVADMLDRAGDRLAASVDRRTLARFILAAVEGAMLEARVRRSLQPFDDTVAELRHHLGALQTPETSAASSRRSQPRPTPQQPARGADWRAW
jgi:AcrR family transcriptional regulator